MPLSNDITTRRYRMLVDLPFLPKDHEYVFEDESGRVYAILDGKEAQYALRDGLANYLWLLLTEREYLARVIDP